MGKKYFLEVVIKAKDTLSVTLGKAGRGVRSFGGALASAGKQAWSTVRGIGKLAAGLGIAGYGIREAGTWLYGLAKDAIVAGDALGKLKIRTGLSVETIQELGHAASLSGVSAEEFAGSLDTMTKQIGMLIAGKGKLKGFLQEVAGPEFARALKTASPEARLELVLGGLLQITDEAKRAAYATAFFGEGGAKMAVLADAGAESIAAMRKEAHDLGLVLTQEDVSAMEEAGDEFERFEKSVDSVKRTVGVELSKAMLPVLKEAVRWIKENRAEIGRWAKSFAEGVVDAAKGLKDAFVWIIDNGPAVGAAMLLALGPITAAAAAIAGVIAGLAKLANMNERDRKKALYEGADSIVANGGDVTGAIGMIANSDVVRTDRADLATKDALAVGGVTAANRQFEAITAPQRARSAALAEAKRSAGVVTQQAGALKIQIDVKDPNGMLKTPTVKSAPAGAHVGIKKPDTGTRTTKHLDR